MAMEIAGNGGGILVDAGATLNLDQVVVTNNSAYADSAGNYGNGGGIENDGSLTVTQSIFTNNVASGGDIRRPHHRHHHRRLCRRSHRQPGAFPDGDQLCVHQQPGGRPRSTGHGDRRRQWRRHQQQLRRDHHQLHVHRQSRRSAALTNGGAISTGENETFARRLPLAISNCTFTGNEAVGANGANNSAALFGGQALGGAIANAGPLTIANSTFTDNVAKGGDQGDNVGGLDPSPVLGEVMGRRHGQLCQLAHDHQHESLAATRPSAATPPSAPAVRPRAAASPRKSLLTRPSPT